MKVHRSAIKVWCLVGLLSLLFAFPFLGLSEYVLYVLTFTAIYGPIVLGLRLTLNSGVFNLAQNTAVMLGAYITAIGAVRFGMSFWPLLILSGVLTAFLGSAVGFLCLRVKGFYFAILSFCLLPTLRLICIEVPFLGGVGGISNIPRPALEFPFAHIRFDTLAHFYYLAVPVNIVAFLFFLRFDKSRSGRHARAVRENSELAEGSGINVTLFQTMVIAISFFWAGISGAILSSFHGYMGPDSITPWDVMLYVAYTVIGGLGSVWGALVGTIIGVVMPEIFREVKAWQHVAFGITLLAIVLWQPKGLVGILEAIKAKSGSPERETGESTIAAD